MSASFTLLCTDEILPAQFRALAYDERLPLASLRNCFDNQWPEPTLCEMYPLRIVIIEYPSDEESGETIVNTPKLVIGAPSTPEPLTKRRMKV